MTQVMTPGEAAQRVRALAAGIDKPLILAFRRSMTTARTEAVNQLRKRGVGRALWGKKPKGARLMVKRLRVRVEGGVITGGLESKGLAAMVEQGGKTAPHEIKPKLAGVLAFRSAGKRLGDVLGLRPGSLAFARKVDHRGSRIPSQPYMGQGFQRGVERFNTEADREIQLDINRLLG